MRVRLPSPAPPRRRGNRSPGSRDAAYVRAVCVAVRTLILPTNESLHQARRGTRRGVTVEAMAMAIGPADWNGGRAEGAVISAERGRPQPGRPAAQAPDRRAHPSARAGSLPRLWTGTATPA